ncbi:outer membrane beta-barrel protein, partial [Camelimonas fluminis]
MKKILLAGVAAATMLAAGSAFAADLPSRKYAPVAPVVIAPVFTWTGFYVGVNAGYAWNTNDDKNNYGYGFTPYYYGSNSNNDGGFAGGGQIGYNYQIGQFVIGAEADIQYADLKQKNNGFGYASNRNGIEWYGTVRARAGFAFDRALIYVTGGFAYGGGDSNNNYAFGYPGYYYGGNNSDTKVGWVLGGGLEYAFTDNLTARVEGMYVSLEKDKNSWGNFYATNAYYYGGSNNKRNEFGVV